MGKLKNYVTQNIVLLRTHHVFGRMANSDTLMESKDVSNLHASIRWDGSRWQIFDYSKNGTWIDGNRIVPQKTIPLEKGSLIQFGGDQQSAWQILDLEKPCPLLVPLKGNEPEIKLKPFNALPNDKNHEISIYLSSSERWMKENEEEEIPLNDGDLVYFDKKTWRFFNSPPLITTQSKIGINLVERNNSSFFFQVSLDEEHVSLKLEQPDGVLELGERVHHYLLLTLARQRLKDAKEGFDLTSQGWIDLRQLTKILSLDYSYLNNQVFRARKQITGMLQNRIPYPSNIIERRPGELRFGFPWFKIFRGSTLEGELNL